MRETEILVVGGGIFGSTIAAALRARGAQVMLVDASLADSGSAPSACLMKPSWLSGMRREDTRVSLGLLDELFGLQQLSFKIIGPARLDDVHWVDPHRIYDVPREWGRVDSIQRHPDGWVARFSSFGTPEVLAQRVVVATGHWAGHLAPTTLVEPRWGQSLFWPGRQIEQPFISAWAPYRQIVAFNMGDRGVWAGDGSALTTSGWTVDRVEKSRRRVADSVGLPVEEAVITRGARPYVDKRQLGGAPCLLREDDPNLWVATGGAKNGTMAAGWAAAELTRRFLG